VDEKFFACFADSEVTKGKLNVTALLEKQTVMMILDLHIDGTVVVLCDRCGEPFDLPLSVTEKYYVKFGEESEDADEIIVLNHSEHELKIANLIFELIIVNLPFKRVHEEGKCDPEVLKKLEEYKPEAKDEKDDPRWDALKNIHFN
jgi:uncharacterized metal-binding protein YceD (DUF177 family)